MIRGFFLGLLLVGSAASAQSVSCTCRYNGQDYGIGQSICLKSPGGLRMATCSMVLNNTSWTMSDAPCPFSALDPGMLPALTAPPEIAPAPGEQEALPSKRG